MLLQIKKAVWQRQHPYITIDTDPQASLTIACGIEPGNPDLNGHGILELYTRKKNINLTDAAFAIPKLPEDYFIYIVPSEPNLALIENEIATDNERAFFLKDACDALKNYFDYIFIDCPPNLGIFVTNALVAADEAVIPVEPTKLAFSGMDLIKDSIRHVQESKRLNPDLILKGAVLTKFRSNVNTNKMRKNDLEAQELLLGTVRLSNDVSKVEESGVPVVFGNPKCDAAKDYEKIAKLL